MATTQVTPKRGGLNWKDVLKGLAVSAGTAALAGVYTTIQNSGNFPNAGDLKQAGVISALAGIAYLIKNLATPQQIVVQNPDPVEAQAVKDGKAEVTITPK